MSLYTPSRAVCWALICAGTAGAACSATRSNSVTDKGSTGSAGAVGVTNSATSSGGSNAAGAASDTETAVTSSGGTTSGDTSSDTSSGDSGAGGDPGTGGDGASGGTGGETTGTGGSTTTSVGGSTTTSVGGSTTTGTGGTTTGTGGGGGTGEPELGAPCDSQGELACNGAAQKLQLICEDGTWENNGSCGANENCEQRSGVCAPIDAECDGLDAGDRYCDDKTVRECGPDQVNSIAIEQCSAACLVFEGQGRCVTVKQVAAGAHTCAVLSTGQLRCWGYNISGQLGLGHTENIGDQAFEMPPADVPLNEHALHVAVASAGSHSCAVLETGAVRCWGKNDYGQLGLGHTETIGDNEAPTTDVDLEEPAVQVALGSDHTCALLVSGAVRCWGSSPWVGFTTSEHIGDTETPTQNVPLGDKAVQIAAGVQHTCALLESGKVRCWGNSIDHQLGVVGAQDMDPSVLPTIDVEIVGTAVGIAAGGYASCALTAEYGGSLWCWGDNFSYQLGNGAPKLWADDESIMPPPPTPVGAPIVAVGVSSYNGCALTTSGEVRCWGRANYAGFGQEGVIASAIQSDKVSGELVATMPPPAVDLGEAAMSLSVGMGTVCAILESGNLRCWGSGILGYGDTSFVGDDETPAELGPVPLF